MVTNYGPTVLFGLEDSSRNPVKVFLPKRYCAAFSEEDANSVNSKKVLFHLVYKGMVDKTYVLAIEK
jgi:hypothetical protein